MKIFNKHAPSSYRVFEKIEAGIVLTGAEVKAVKANQVDLTSSYIKIMGSEAYLVNARIIPYQYARPENYDERRTRKLLLHKKEIITLKGKLSQGSLTIIPVSIYTRDNLIKLELAVARHTKKYEKKRALKEKDLERETEQELKQRLRI